MNKKTIFIILIIAIIPTIILSVLYYIKLYDDLENNLKYSVVAESKEKSRELSTIIQNKLISLKQIGQLKIFSIAMEFDRYEGLERFFDSMLKVDFSAFGFIFIDSNEVIKASSTYDNKNRFIPDSQMYWKKIFNDTSFLTDQIGFVEKLDNSLDCLVLKVPILDDFNAEKGYILGVFSLDSVYNSLKESVSKLNMIHKKNFDYYMMIKSLSNYRFLFISKEHIEDEIEKNKIMYFCGKNEETPLNVTINSCFQIEKSALYDEIFRLSIFFAVTIIGLIVLLYFISYYVFKTNFKSVTILLHKLEDIAKGNYKTIETSDDTNLKKYIDSANDIIKKIVSYQQEIDKQTKMSAIAKVTATLAHDVRKPFTMVKSVLDAFDSFSQNKSLLESFKKEIDQSLMQVQAMIDDIMDYSREVRLQTKPTLLLPILELSLHQVFQKDLEATIHLKYNLYAKCLPMLDDKRIIRVLVNILSNAVEAITIMGKKQEGTIIIDSYDITENNRAYVQIRIMNDGPVFLENAEKQLFETFFTSGKNNGTGLGLASCHKIVSLHNGSIVAKNLESLNGVVFIINLPASQEQDTQVNKIHLPENNHQIVKSFKVDSSFSVDYQDIQKRNDRIHILLLEDELMYKAWVRQLIEDNDVLKQKMSLFEASSVEEAIELLEAVPIHYAIVDIDLKTTKTGFDFLRYLQEQQRSLPCLIHSNRTLSEFKQQAIDLGAKGFIPKPLPLEAFVRFINAYSIESRGEEKKSSLKIQEGRCLTIYFCDDSVVALRMFEFHMDEIAKRYSSASILYKSFSTGEKLLDVLKTSPADVVLADQNMRQSGGILTGVETVKQSKIMYPSIKAYVVSNESVSTMTPLVLNVGGDGAYDAAKLEEVLGNLVKSW